MAIDDYQDEFNPYAAPKTKPGHDELGPASPTTDWPEGSPWVTIWTQPRATIRKIVETDPTQQIYLLAILSGIARALDRSTARDAGDVMPMVGVLGVSLIGGAIGGLLSLYIMGALLKWTGQWLGGVAEVIEVRAALAWSSVPIVATLLITGVQIALIGDEMFTSITPRLAANPSLAFFLIGSGLVEVVLGIWSLILFLKCLGEVHRFSAWRALGAALLAGLLILALMLPIILLLVFAV